MSGGSFDYLCWRNASDIFRDDHLEHMERQLVAMGFAAREAASATAKVLAIRERLEAEVEDLREVWKAIEWWQSGDWSEEQAWKAIGAWEAGRRAKSEGRAD